MHLDCLMDCHYCFLFVQGKSYYPLDIYISHLAIGLTSSSQWHYVVTHTCLFLLICCPNTYLITCRIWHASSKDSIQSIDIEQKELIIKRSNTNREFQLYQQYEKWNFVVVVFYRNVLNNRSFKE